MTDLINTDLPQVAEAAPQKYPLSQAIISAARQPVVQIVDGEALADSRDVAAYFGKEHRRVLQTIRELSCSDDFRRHNFVPFKIKDLTGEATSHVMMTKDGFIFLAMGFTGTKAAAFKERYIVQFNAMESELRRRDAFAGFDIPKDYAGALRLAAVQVEKVALLEAKVEEASPKVAFFDRFVEADGLYTMQNAGRALGCRPNLFCQWLREAGYVFRQDGALMPYVKFRAQGLFEVKSGICKSDGKARPQSYITAKGIEYFSTRVPGVLKIGLAA